MAEIAAVAVAAVVVPILVPVVLDSLNDNWPKIVELFEKFLDDLPRILSALGRAARWIGGKLLQGIQYLGQRLKSVWVRIRSYLATKPQRTAPVSIPLPSLSASNAKDKQSASAKQQLQDRRSAVTSTDAEAMTKRRAVERMMNLGTLIGDGLDDINDILLELDLDDPARSQLQVLSESTRGRLSAVRQLVQ